MLGQSGYGYGLTPRCSALQQEWQTHHPLFLAIQPGHTIKTYYAKNKLGSVKLSSVIGDPSVLLPPAVMSLVASGSKPELIHYVQLPLYLWVPDYFYPDLVSHIPCPVEGCRAGTTRRRWHSGGPRLIHGVQHAMYLHCWEYECSSSDHKGKTFCGWDQGSLMKLPSLVRSLFRFVLTPEEGVTLDLHSRIIDARMGGASLLKLQKELTRNRYTRLYETMTAYYLHVEHHMAHSTIFSYSRGSGSESTYAPMPPTLHNVNAYYDFEPPSIHYMSQLRQRYCVSQTKLWSNYTQQLSSSRVCIDATFKVAKRVRATNVRLLWSMMDIETSCILTQQLLTHETHDDVLPMLTQYTQRCKELGVQLPTRVCSDRGLMDSNIIHHPSAFPEAHINVDPWHFQQLFTNTLNKGSSVWKDVSSQFKQAVYVKASNDDGRSVLTHAEPDVIIAAVDALIKRFSHAGSDAVAAITKKTSEWWNAQKGAILQHRMCSHPRTDLASRIKMSSSPLENYHRQLNSVLRNLVHCSEESMHVFLVHYMFRWNVDRRRASGAEYNWHTYDLALVDDAYQACVKALGTPRTASLWGRTFSLPRTLQTLEHFGLFHPHVSLNQHMMAAQGSLPYSDALLASIHSNHMSLMATPFDIACSTPVTPGPTLTGGLPPFPSTANVAPLTRLTKAELDVLATLRKSDPMFQQALKQEQWELAATRWNSFREQSNAIVGRTQLHVVYGDIIKKAVALLDGQADRKLEHNFILRAADRAAQDIEAAIPYVSISPLVQQFSQYEDENLRSMVQACSKASISWNKVTKRWMCTYQAQVEANSVVRLTPRSDEMLRSRWVVLKRRDRNQTATAAPHAKEEMQEKMVVEEENEEAEQEGGAEADSVAAGKEEMQIHEESTAWESELHTPIPASRRLSTGFSSLCQWLSPPPSHVTSSSPLVSPVSTLSTSTSISSASSTSSSSSSTTIAAMVQPQQQQKEPQQWHWPKPATALFKQLGQQSNFTWTYDEFCAEWPTEEHGYVEEKRFRNKNRIEKLEQRTGSRVKSKRKDTCVEGAKQPRTKRSKENVRITVQ